VRRVSCTTRNGKYIRPCLIEDISYDFQADIDNSGSIDYGEFLAATLHLNKVEREDNLFAAFSYFDKDGSGYITQDELQKACEEFGIGDAHLEEIIRDIDQDNVSRFVLIMISIR
jgi:Ca2+-binding EF-hand superfamily protein